MSERTPLTSNDAEEDEAQRGNEMDIDKAIVSGNVEEVERLITESSDPDSMIRDKKLLHKTLSFGKRKLFVVLNVLLKHASLETLKQIYENDKTVLHIAVEKGHDRCCESILKKNKAMLTSVDKEGDTPLHYAAKLGQTKVCMKIRAYLTPEVINQQNAKNFTSLHFAAREKRHDIMKILLEKGGDPRMTTEQGYTPLHFAARCGSLDCVTQLLATQTCSEDEKEYVNMQTEQLKTALMFAAQSGFATICKKLSATDVTISDVGGKTALHFAATKDCIPVVQFLVDELGADCCQEDDKKQWPLEISVTKKNDKCFNFFLQKIPAEKLVDNVIEKLLKLAAGSSLKCLRHMAERQKFHRHLENFKDDKKNNLLHLTIANKSYATAKQLLENVPFDRLAINEDEETPLHLLAKQSTACLNCHEEDIQWVTRYLLRNAHEIVNLPNKKGETPLHLAAQSGNLEILKSLHHKDPEILKASKQGLTALHYAAQQGHADCLKLLLRSLKAADFAKLREIHIHPLHLASKNGHLECCKLLTNYTGSEDGTDKTLFSLDQGGNYPLDHAFKGKHAELFHFMLCKMKFNKKHEKLSGRLHHYFEKCLRASDRRPWREAVSPETDSSFNVAVLTAVIESEWCEVALDGSYCSNIRQPHGDGKKETELQDKIMPCKSFALLIKNYPELACRAMDKHITVMPNSDQEIHNYTPLEFIYYCIEDGKRVSPFQQVAPSVDLLANNRPSSKSNNRKVSVRSNAANSASSDKRDNSRGSQITGLNTAVSSAAQPNKADENLKKRLNLLKAPKPATSKTSGTNTAVHSVTQESANITSGSPSCSSNMQQPTSHTTINIESQATTSAAVNSASTIGMSGQPNKSGHWWLFGWRLGQPNKAGPKPATSSTSGTNTAVYSVTQGSATITSGSPSCSTNLQQAPATVNTEPQATTSAAVNSAPTIGTSNHTESSSVKSNAQEFKDISWYKDHPFQEAVAAKHRQVLHHKYTKSWLLYKFSYARWILIPYLILDLVTAVSVFFLQLLLWNTHDIEDVFSGATWAQVTEVYPNLWSENSDVQTVMEDVQAIAASDPHCSSWGSKNASSEDILMEVGTSSWNRSVCAVFHMEKKSSVVVGMKVWMVILFLVHLFIEL
ncbi:LOW QUALITY PROTEIN: uncharacterized protein LOC125177630, partial [Hyalella azteca]|uniref:LOW QUALITY PROTEIN: uncharacterized protein LOC125177630 n=1 Tax=Hyalella azteca TaxID=294128 RepID=A0A979FFN9_HYAAZ